MSMSKNPDPPQPQAGQQPVAWRVKDYADGWILFQNEKAAKMQVAETGALIQALYVVEAAQPQPEPACHDCAGAITTMTCRPTDYNGPFKVGGIERAEANYEQEAPFQSATSAACEGQIAESEVGTESQSATSKRSENSRKSLSGERVEGEMTAELDTDVLLQAADYLRQLGGGPMEDRLRLLHDQLAEREAEIARLNAEIRQAHCDYAIEQSQYCQRALDAESREQRLREALQRIASAKPKSLPAMGAMNDTQNSGDIEDNGYAIAAWTLATIAEEAL